MFLTVYFLYTHMRAIEGHALLWHLGIAHGDISLGNLMYRVELASDVTAAADSGHASSLPTVLLAPSTSNTQQSPLDTPPPAQQSASNAPSSSQTDPIAPSPGASAVKVKGVLNDLDLASLIDPETGEFDVKGFERTGTKPHMAYRLLTDMGIDGQIRRRYRHDLESFAWVSVFLCGCIQDGKQTPVKPFSTWLTGSYEQVRDSKANFWREPECYKPTDDFSWFSSLANDWITAWEDIDKKLHQKRDRIQEEEGLAYLEKVRAIAERANVPFALPPMPWIKELGKLEPSQPPKVATSAASAST